MLISVFKFKLNSSFTAILELKKFYFLSKTYKKRKRTIDTRTNLYLQIFYEFKCNTNLQIAVNQYFNQYCEYYS
ncbi:hypothetical protein BTO06_00430 [Tenacibaculum sp. SZ-18]|nr:hypothetical protein BTO06_00430 [Tenacibaculum sp. SZ-18]